MKSSDNTEPQLIEQNLLGDIIIVDDDPVNLRLLNNILKEKGYSVRAAVNGVTAIKAAIAKPADLILLDVRMPEMDGYEVCRRLKENEQTRTIPVIFISANKDLADKIEGFKAGGIDYVAKPFEVEEILVRVNTHISLYNAQRQLRVFNKVLGDKVDEQTQDLINTSNKLLEEEEERVKVSRQNALILKAAGEGIYGVNEDGEISFINPTALAMIDHSEADVIGKNHHALLHHSHADGRPYPQETSPVHITLNDGQVHQRDNEVFWRWDGSSFPVQYTSTPIRDEQDELNGAVVVFHDISSRKQAEQALHESDTRTRLIRELTLSAYQASDLDDVFKIAVDAVCEYSGWPVGHVCRPASDNPLQLESSGIWHLDREEEFEAFKTVTSQTRFDSGVGLPGRVLANKGSLWIEDVNHDAIFLRTKLVSDIAVKAGFGFPVLIDNEVVAVLEFYCESLVEPDEKLQNFMIQIGLQLGFVIERKRKEEQLQQSESRQRAVLAAALEPIVTINNKGIILFASDSILKIFGWQPEELVGKNVNILMPEKYAKEHDSHLVRHEKTGETSILGRSRNFEAMRKDGSTFPCEISINRVNSPVDGTPIFSGCIRDITERKQSEEELRHMATHDSLTGLPNRTLFMELLEYTVEGSKRNNKLHAILFLDLDRFKNINDSLGHLIGDMLLQEVAARLSLCVRGSDSVARLGGDEFTILLYNIDKPDVAATVSAKIISTLSEPFKLAQHEIVITPSIGIVIFPEHGEDSQTLLRNADTAMYHAKSNGRNNFKYFRDDMNERVTERLQIESALRRSIENKEMMLYYQPKVDLVSGDVIGAEALVRWNHPEKGFVRPDIFIPISEETGLILPLGEQILDMAFEQTRIWSSMGILPGKIAVNLSAFQFQQDDLLECIDQLLAKHELSPDYIELEITEGAVLENVEKLIQTMHDFKARGLHLAIDDFGTGYSSLSYLKRFPLDTLKIDMSFIRDMASSQQDRNMVASIINLAQNFDLQVVAEGVETFEQSNILKTMGCDVLQGYLFSKPLPADEFKNLLITKTNLYEPNKKAV